MQPEGWFNPVTQTIREQTLDAAKGAVLGDRDHQYGGPEQNFNRIAQLWNVQFEDLLQAGVYFKPEHVAQALALLKFARMAGGSKHDNYVDAIGYLACAAEVASG